MAFITGSDGVRWIWRVLHHGSWLSWAGTWRTRLGASPRSQPGMAGTKRFIFGYAGLFGQRPTLSGPRPGGNVWV